MPFPRTSVLLAGALVAALAAPHRTALAQRFGDDAPGAETCRDLWQRYGRYGESDPRAVYCTARDVGVLRRRSTVTADGAENGGITVTGDERRGAEDGVRVRLVLFAQASTVDDARALAEDVTLDLDAETLRAEHTGRFASGRVTALIELTTPARTNLSLSVSNGPMDVSDVSGDMDLRAQNGPIALRRVGGDVRVRNRNGPVAIVLDGDRWDGKGLDAQVENGPMSLAIPRNYSAALEAGTENGPFEANFPLTLTRLSGRRIEATIGRGGPPVRAVSQNGPMSLLVAR